MARMPFALFRQCVNSRLGRGPCIAAPAKEGGASATTAISVARTSRSVSRVIIATSDQARSIRLCGFGRQCLEPRIAAQLVEDGIEPQHGRRIVTARHFLQPFERRD